MSDENPEESDSPQSLETDSDYRPIEPKSRKFKSRRLLIFVSSFVAVVILVFAGFYLGTHFKKTSDVQKTQGGVALSEQDLRDVVNAKHLTVYWTGPVGGDKYTLLVPKTGVAVIRYLPGGAGLNDASSTFRLVATYVQKNAFSITQKAGAKVGNLGFINIDGNSVFYVKSRSTNVYVGMKNKDIQLEIFDPGQDQAVALSLFRGQIQKVG